MKSKASIKGHPIHPIIVGFPIAFFAGTFIFDLLGTINSNPGFIQTGKYLEISGIGMSVVAAIFGFIDYTYTLPPKSSAAKRGTTHMILNLVNVVLFAVALYFRGSDSISFTLIIILEGVGMVILGIAGWMGGTLVYRNQIGVDIRYADAGKWQEESFKDVNNSVAVGKPSDLGVNQMKLLIVNGKRIVLARSEEGYYAFDDACTHRGGSLAGGTMICGTVQCPWHGSQFDVTNGKVKCGPAKKPINTYGIIEKTGRLFLTLKA